MRAARALVLVGTVLAGVLVPLAPSKQASFAVAAECTLRVGPGIPPPASVPSGIPGYHAHWYGQSGYPTLCPGQTSNAVVAYYNSGSLGWRLAPLEFAFLGTSGPEPGQDRPTVIGGDGTEGGPNTRWRAYNRPAHIPAPFYVGPGQVAWFQFTVKAPSRPGTYRVYIRPLIEGVQWMEDFGVYWQITVVPASAPQRVTVTSVNTNTDLIIAGTETLRYDANDAFEWSDAVVTYEQFERLLSAADVLDVRYELASSGVSSFNIVSDFGHAPPTVNAQGGNFDRGSTNNDVSVTVTAPNSNGSLEYAVQRAIVPAGTTACDATSGAYKPDHSQTFGSFIDRDLPSGTYCYRAGAHNQAASWTAFGYSQPVSVPAP